MKKIAFTLLSLVLIYGRIHAQSAVPIVQNFQNPTDASVCNINSGFGLTNLDPATLPNGQWPATFTLSLEIFVTDQPLPFPFNPGSINNPWGAGVFPECYNLTPVTNHYPIQLVNAGVTLPFALPINALIPVNPAWNGSTLRFDFIIEAPPGSSAILESLDFDAYLDCSLSGMSGSSLNIIQKWFYNSIPLQATPPFPVLPVPVLKPNMAQIVPASQLINVQAPYGQTSTWTFIYQNNGTGNAKIDFTFSTDPCPAYTISNTEYIVSNDPPTAIPTSGYTQYPPAESIDIDAGQYQYVRQTVFITGCVENCDPSYVHFEWSCSDHSVNGPPPIQSPLPYPGNICSQCEYNYSTQLNFLKGTEQLSATRTWPPEDRAFNDNTCQGDTTMWRFVLENTETAAIALAHIELENLYANSVSLVGASTLQKVENCANCVVSAPYSTPLTLPPALTGCMADVPDPVSEFGVSIANLAPGETVELYFTEYHCCSSDPVLFGVNKVYNQ